MIRKSPWVFAMLLAAAVTGITRAHVDLDYPAGGETFMSGSSITVEWHEIVDHGDAVWDLYYSSDGGGSWQAIALSLPHSQAAYDWTIPGAATAQGRIRVVQNNASAPDYEGESGDFTVSISSRVEKDPVPNTIRLLPAYPNPFNTSVVFSFELSTTERVSLKLYNIRGKLIEILMDEQTGAGMHTLTWNASGKPAGIYTVRMTSPGFTQSRRVVFIK